MKNILLTVCLLTLMLPACENAEEKRVEELKAQIIKIHDEAMPMMDDIANLRKSLNERLVILDSTENSQKAAMLDAISQLKEADNAMMNWMRNYKTDLKDFTTEEKKKYLEQELLNVESMYKMVTEGIATANQVLEGMTE